MFVVVVAIAVVLGAAPPPASPSTTAPSTNPVTSPTAPAPDASRRLVVTSGLRVRAAPNAAAAVVDKVAIGVVLPCTRRSAVVAIAGERGPFCKTTTPGGATGWFFEPLTAPVEPDMNAQLRRLVDERTGALAGGDTARWPDVYEFHRFLLRRIGEAKVPDAKLRARVDELRFVAQHGDAFSKDARVYGDDSQGLRVKLDAVDALAKDAAGTVVADDADWLRVEIGPGGECEGFVPCALHHALRFPCVYLAAHPDGAHAAEVVDDVTKLAAWIVDPQRGAEMPDQEALPLLDDLATCAATSQRGDVAAAQAAIGKARALARTKPKAPPSSSPTTTAPPSSSPTLTPEPPRGR